MVQDSSSASSGQRYNNRTSSSRVIHSILGRLSTMVRHAGAVGLQACAIILSVLKQPTIAQKTAEFWSKKLREGDPSFSSAVYWLAVPQVYRHYMQRATGAEATKYPH